MELSEIIPHIEALIFASDRPLTSLEIVDLINNAFGFMEQQITLDQVDTSLDGIREKYSSAYYPFEVLQSGGGWQFLSKPSFHTTIAQLNGGKFLKKLSNAAMETLSIIAYKQPITKGEIESIRGVNSDYSVQKLLEKELIVISGRNEELPGKPLIYETSKNFMDYFGLNSVEDLPKIREVLAEQMVEPLMQERYVESDQDFGIFKKEIQADEQPELTNQNGDQTPLLADETENAVDQEGEESANIEHSEQFEQSEQSVYSSTDTDFIIDDAAEGSDAVDLEEEEELADQELNDAIATEQQELESELHPDLDHLANQGYVGPTDEASPTDEVADIQEVDIEEEELADEFTDELRDELADGQESELRQSEDGGPDQDLDEVEKGKV